MVITPGISLETIGCLLAAEPASSVFERLDPPRRAAVVMALLGLVLVGLVLTTCVMLGAHWVRRLARHNPANRRTESASNHVVENRRLRGALENILPPHKAGETVHMDGSTKETKADPP